MIFQKALSPAHVAQLVEGNRDTVSGFVLNAADVAGLSKERLFQAHGVGFAGSPWDPNASHFDVLRFAEPPAVYVHTPFAPEFVDRPPFTGNGFALFDGGYVPQYFLDEVRIPPAAELYRITPDGNAAFLAVYRDVANGWALAQGSGLASPAPSLPSLVMGWVAVWDGFRFSADLVKDNTAVILAATSQPPEEVSGFTRTERGCWAREVPVADLDELFELNSTCRFNGEPFRITAVSYDGETRLFRLFYTGHNADTAESMRLNKSDAGVYWTVVPETEVTDVELIQNTLKDLRVGS